MKKIAVFSSGSGTTFEHLSNTIKYHQWPIKIEALIADRDCQALVRARTMGITPIKVEPIKGLSLDLWDQKVLQLLKPLSLDLIFLLGFLRKVQPRLLKAYNKKIVNTHPSLLPNYGGKGMFGSIIHQSVVRDRQKETGVTLHWVDENYDTGSIIAQKVVPLMENESADQVENRVKAIEKEFIIETLPKILDLKYF